jgi:hypothetical protein
MQVLPEATVRELRNPEIVPRHASHSNGSDTCFDCDLVDACHFSIDSSAWDLVKAVKLAARYPNRPRAHAIVLHAIVGRYCLGRQYEPYGNEKHAPSTALLDSFLDHARAGERLDPENAFFPLMRAIGLYSEAKDAEARAALQEAADCTDFADYTFVTAQALHGLMDETVVPDLYQYRWFRLASATHAYTVELEALARKLAVAASKLEASGSPVQGLAMRRDLMAVGALMKAKATSFYVNWIGRNTVAASIRHANGKTEPATNPLDDRAEPPGKARKRRMDGFIDLARSAGNPAVHSWLMEFRKEAQSDQQARKKHVRHHPRKVMRRGSWLWWYSALALGIGLSLFVAGACLALRIRGRSGIHSLPLAYCLGAAVTMLVLARSISSGSDLHMAPPNWSRSGLTPISFLSDLLLMRIPLQYRLAIGLPGLLILAAARLLGGRHERDHAGASARRFATGLKVTGALVLVVGYVPLTVLTAMHERKCARDLQAELTNQSAFAAERMGNEWPPELNLPPKFVQ